jgi:hypothetical protein
LLHLELDLVLEVSGVLEGCLIEDEEVGCARENIVNEDTEKPAAGASVHADTKWEGNIMYHVMRYNETACLRQSSRDHALMYAYLDGEREKDFVDGAYCHVACGTA